MTLFDRPELAARILARPEPVVVLEAPAGMGKSTLLRQIGASAGIAVHARPDAPGPAALVLWDLPPGTRPEALPEAFLAGSGKLILAKRPDVEMAGLARALAYGQASVIGAEDLLFNEAELARHFPGITDILDRTGGWPLLLPYVGSERANIAPFLRSEFLETLPSSELFGLRDRMEGLGPRLFPSLPFAGAPTVLQQALGEALETVVAQRMSDPNGAQELALVLADRGDMTKAITTLQHAGHLDAALELFKRASDRFYIYRYGPEAFGAVLAGFPPDYARNSDTITLSLAMQALKRGELARAHRLLSERFGEDVNDLTTVFSDRTAYSPDFLAFRLVMMIYEDYLLTDTLFEQVFALADDFPPDAHLLQGTFYNAVLEFYIRSRRFAAAEDVAAHALRHYRQANVPHLCFYISLHQSLMRLMMGDAVSARTRATEARQYLGSVGFDSPDDDRLLVLLDACIDYEGGSAEPLARFLHYDLDAFAHGEIWPSLIEFALHYGSQALSEHFSTIAARSFLDRWRVYQIRNRQFGMMIEMREAAILQNANRWQEAAEKLAPVPSRVTRDWVLGAPEALERLQDRDEIALALIWLRHHVFEMPTRPGLDRQLEAMLNNLNITGRQRMGVEIWLAFVAKRLRNLTRARSLLLKTFEEAARLGAVAPLAEERHFLSELIEHQRIGEFLEASGPARQALRRLRDSGLPNSSLGAQNGLSRRETKVLLMVTEGGSNKFIANTLGLSEATVKFHLGNVYRKLGCTRRREAISAARALGLVG